MVAGSRSQPRRKLDSRDSLGSHRSHCIEIRLHTLLSVSLSDNNSLPGKVVGSLPAPSIGSNRKMPHSRRQLFRTQGLGSRTQEDKFVPQSSLGGNICPPLGTVLFLASYGTKNQLDKSRRSACHVEIQSTPGCSGARWSFRMLRL